MNALDYTVVSRTTLNSDNVESSLQRIVLKEIKALISHDYDEAMNWGDFNISFQNLTFADLSAPFILAILTPEESRFVYTEISHPDVDGNLHAFVTEGSHRTGFVLFGEEKVYRVTDGRLVPKTSDPHWNDSTVMTRLEQLVQKF